jgi:hypothetical protein|tara:strand:- start:1473 stop:1955 length:483 start_codon:yes stop_codon:yes gene_type:complete
LKDNIITFPTNRIVADRTRELDTQRKKMSDKVSKEIQKQQTKKFVETAVDDISMNLLKSFVDLAMKTNNPNFTKDLALLVDVMRGMIYRDFELPHPAQLLADKMVKLKTNQAGTVSAKLDYADVLGKPAMTKPISGDVKNELKDLNDTLGFFEPDGDLDD